MSPFHYTRDILDNGLRVVTVEIPHLHTAMLAAYVRLGSRHETAQHNGVSHFLEHIFFRGSERFPHGRSMNAAIEDAGGGLNGVTARDHSYFYTPVHPAHLGLAVEIMGDMLTRPLFKEVDVEREVILEEMLDEVDEEGRDIDVDNLSKQTLFAGHPLALKIAGTPETVRGLREDDLRAHHLRHYHTGNIVLCAAGRVRRDNVLRLAEAHFAGLAPGRPSEEAPPALDGQGPRLVFVEHEGESQTEFQICFPLPPEHHPDFPAAMILRRILDDGLSSRLQSEIVERQGLAYAVRAGIETFSDCSLFQLDAACAPAKVPRLAAALFQLLADLRDTPVPADEIQRVKLRHRINLEFALDSAGELAGWFGGTEIFRAPESFEERIARVENVRAEDLQRVAAATFVAEKTTVVGVGHKNAKLAATVAGAFGR